MNKLHIAVYCVPKLVLQVLVFCFKENVYCIHKYISQILTMPEIDDSPNAERSLVSSDLELESCWRRRDLEVEA